MMKLFRWATRMGQNLGCRSLESFSQKAFEFLKNWGEKKVRVGLVDALTVCIN